MRGVVVAATTGIGATLMAPMAAHAALVCGQTITSSMTLDQDLNCPSGNGININSNNVVLDLGGHSITGARATGSSRGVSVMFDRHGVVVRNGIVRGFDQGVGFSGLADGTVTGMTLDGTGLGILTQTGSSGSRLLSNNIVNTIQFSGIQLGGNGHLVEGNRFFAGNGAGVFLSGNDNIVRRNTIADMGQNGVSVGTFPSSPGPFLNNQILENQISAVARLGNATSISLNNASGTRVVGNTISGRRVTPGVFVFNSNDTLVSTNTLTNNASTGVLVRGTSNGTQVLANRSTSNSFSGISIENGPTQTVVADNMVSSNGSNGIDVRSASTTVARNTATSNGVWGIFAVAGATDGGGNRASGNGNPAQCTANIACS